MLVQNYSPVVSDGDMKSLIPQTLLPLLLIYGAACLKAAEHMKGPDRKERGS